MIRTLDGSVSRLAVPLIVLTVLWLLSYPSVASAMSGFGGYVSEKLLGDGTAENLYLGDGSNELSVLGSGPRVATVGATSFSAGNVVTMTMTGSLQSLNGMPQAYVWFRWGYTPSMVNNTATVTMTSTGEQSISIHPEAGKTVYYQFRASTDSVSSGSVLSILITGRGHGISYWMLNTLLPVVIAGTILVGTLLLTGNPILALLASITGLVGFYIVLLLVNSI